MMADTGFVAQVSASRNSWTVSSVAELTQALSWRDRREGAHFHITLGGRDYPELGMRFTGGYAVVHYFPSYGHPGFRCLGGDGLPQGGSTRFVYQGCDPSAGEDTPNQFIVTTAVASTIAEEFFRTGKMSDAVKWMEL
jgi:hypothetical protein